MTPRQKFELVANSYGCCILEFAENDLPFGARRALLRAGVVHMYGHKIWLNHPQEEIEAAIAAALLEKELPGPWTNSWYPFVGSLTRFFSERKS
jgi:hypothetical protein